MRWWTVISITLLSASLTFAETIENENSGPGVDQDSFLPWISKEEVKNNPFHITLAAENPAAELIFNSRLTSQRAVYAPSLRGLFAIGLTDARYFGLTAGLPLKQEDADIRKNGTTDYNDFRFNFAAPRRFIQVGYTQYRGFYLSNSRAVDNTWTGGPYLRADDLYKRTVYMNAMFIARPHRYSLESAIGQTARQVLSGGSWLWGISARDEKVSNPTEIIPVLLRPNFGRDQNVRDATMRSVFARLGYGYQYNFTQSIYANAYLIAGYGAEQLDLRGSDLNHRETKSTSKIDAQLSLVNNGKTYFGGTRALIDNATYATSDIKIDSNFYTFTIFFGRRLH